MWRIKWIWGILIGYNNKIKLFSLFLNRCLRANKYQTRWSLHSSIHLCIQITIFKILHIRRKACLAIDYQSTHRRRKTWLVTIHYKSSHRKMKKVRSRTSYNHRPLAFHVLIRSHKICMVFMGCGLFMFLG